MKDSQYYSKIALNYLRELSKKDGVKYTMVCYGNLIDMEELFDLFGGNREKLAKQQIVGGQGVKYRFKFVMDKLDRESKKPDAIFEKGFIKYTGIIKKPTRCFSLKDKASINESTMLKIKDSVDLKMLERYGFVYKQEQKNQYEHYAYISKTENDFYPVLRCYVYCQDRRIGVNTNNIDILFDLIQSGLVEKVEGK